MKKFLSVLLCVAMLLSFAVAAFAAEPTRASMDFADDTYRTENTTEKQVWAKNGITLTNDKANASKVSDAINPVHFNKNTTVTVEFTGMTGVEFVCSAPNFAQNLANSITQTDANVKVSLYKENEPYSVIVDFGKTVDSFVITLSAGAAWMTGITVYKVMPSQEEIAAKPAMCKIDAIGTVTLASLSAIEAARNAYEALTDAQKAFVTNLEVLTAAEKEYAALLADTTSPRTYVFGDYPKGTAYAIDEVHKLDDITTLTTTKCSFTTTLRLYSSAKYDGFAVFHFAKKISKISMNIGYAADTVNVYASTDGTNWTLINELAVVAAYQDYEILIPEDANYSYLKLDVVGTKTVYIKSATIHFAETDTAPEEPSADQVAANAVIAKIDAIGTVTLESKTMIEAARAEYDKLTDAQKQLVTNLDTLLAAEEELNKLESAPVTPAGDNGFVFFILAALSMTALVVLTAKKRAF